jgi:hypothetical protein
MLILREFILLFFAYSILIQSSLQKNVFSNFLNEDNELILLENNVNKNGKTTNTKISKNIQSENKNDNSIRKDQNKLIVNIVYASKDKNQKNIELVSSSSSSAQLVYITDLSNPCDKNLCKLNEMCQLISNKSVNYKCVPVKNTTKKQSNVSINKSDIQIITKSPFRTSKSNCNLNKLKLNLYKKFENYYSKFEQLNKHLYLRTQSKISTKSTFSLCHESVNQAFSQIDNNHDQLIDLNDFMSYYGNREICLEEFFHSCNLNDDIDTLNLDEFCQCFQNYQPKCNFIRNQLNLNTRVEYIAHVNQLLLNSINKPPVQLKNKNKIFKLNVKYYVPLCDLNGYFLPTQCDNEVNCWCVNKNGEPIQNTFRKIDQNTIDCNNVV